jgi:hypothetical protein
LVNNGTNNIIDTFTKSSKYLAHGTCASKSITKVSKIELKNAKQYGPHILPVIDNCIVKDIVNNVEKSHGNNLNAFSSHPIVDPDITKNNYIYIAHYACQDLTTFVKRKCTNKENYYWWINVIGVLKRKDVYNYIDIINGNFHNFVNHLNDKMINNKKLPFDGIPECYIEKIIFLYCIPNF